MSLVIKAYEFAKNAHKGQKDFAGNDYITHPIFVQAHLDSDILKICGYLHDTVEDTNVTLEEIDKIFGSEVRSAIDALTKREGEDYLEYIERLMKNPIAVSVKRIDLIHNMDLSRVSSIKDKDLFRIENKYKPAYRRITGHNLLLSEQLDSKLSDYEIRHLLFNILSKRLKFERIDSNIEYILKGYSNAISDPLKDYIEGVLKDEILCD